MGLPVRQRRVLERIEITLNGSDPKLAALYGIFARLNRDEEMPRIEQLRHGAQAVLARLRMIAAAICSKLRWPFRLQPHQRVALYFPIAVAVAITAIVFVARATPGNSCTQPRAQSTAHNKSKLCRAPYSLSPLYLGK
ncbi:MAG TPA: hypothetical protein VMB74_19635 [Streptosporangiaceae bacterium]|nr:hypothetical protein [Streptosporangiaceae bacterium]